MKIWSEKHKYIFILRLIINWSKWSKLQDFEILVFSLVQTSLAWLHRLVKTVWYPSFKSHCIFHEPLENVAPSCHVTDDAGSSSCFGPEWITEPVQTSALTPDILSNPRLCYPHLCLLVNQYLCIPASMWADFYKNRKVYKKNLLGPKNIGKIEKKYC